MIVYCNGTFVPQEEARIAAADHGFLYGVGVFETFRTFGGNPFLLDEHMERMHAGCEALHIAARKSRLLEEGVPYSRLRKTIQRLLSENKMPDATFRYTVSAGEAPPGLPAGVYENPVEIIQPRALPPPLPAGGIQVHILNTARVEPGISPRPKSLDYVNSLAGHFELRSRSGVEAGDEGLMLTRDGRLAEGIVSNLFIIKNSRLVTPTLCTGILGGVTRKKVIELAARAGLRAAEEDAGLCALTEAEAIFMTNSTRGIVPVCAVFAPDGRRIWQSASSEHSALAKLAGVYEHLSAAPA